MDLGPRARRRQATIDEVLAAASDLARGAGLASISMRELGTRVGLHASSLYQYFPSKDAIYDALFAQGHRELHAWMAALDRTGRPVDVLKRGSRLFIEFCLEDAVRYQLLFQRTVPGFAPSEASMALAWQSYRDWSPPSPTGVTAQADVDLWTAIQMGITGQQWANDPGGRRFADHIEPAVDMFLAHVKRRKKEGAAHDHHPRRRRRTHRRSCHPRPDRRPGGGRGRFGPPRPRGGRRLAVTGINRLLLPAELGGFAVPPRRTVEIVEQLAATDGSTAWAAAIGFGTNHFAGYLPPDGAAEVFADPDQSNASMFAALAEVTEAPDGTLRLSGRWPFTSNCEQAAWIGLAARFPNEPAPRLVFVPRSEVTIHATWDVAGLRATASNDTSVSDVEVHRRHTCSFADRPWPAGPLWRLPLFVVLAPPLAAVSLGVARGAVEEVNRRALSRRAQMRGSLLDDPVGMADLAAADALLRGARAGLLAVADECWARAEAGEPVDRALQARAFLAAQHCCDVAVDVCSTAHRLGSGAAAYRTSPLQRALRDVDTRGST